MLRHLSRRPSPGKRLEATSTRSPTIRHQPRPRRQQQGGCRTPASSAWIVGLTLSQRGKYTAIQAAGQSPSSLQWMESASSPPGGRDCPAPEDRREGGCQKSRGRRQGRGAEGACAFRLSLPSVATLSVCGRPGTWEPNLPTPQSPEGEKNVLVLPAKR